MSNLSPSVRRQPTAAPSNPKALTPAAPPDSSLTQVEANRLHALLDRYASVPMPVAVAMIKRASQGPVGVALNQLETALDQLNNLPDFETLSGSEVRMLDVALYLINTRIAELQNSLNRVWGSRI